MSIPMIVSKLWLFCRAAIKEGREHSFEYRTLAADGRAIWLCDVVRIVPGGEGKGQRLLGLMIDITKRKRAEESLRIAEKTFRDLLETIQLAALLLDREGNITFSNDYLLRMAGFAKEEVLGRNWFDLFIPFNEREKIRKVFASLINGEMDIFHYENSIATRDGKKLLISWSN